MEPQLNPYNPGSGVQPSFLAGRDDEIAAFDLLVARTGNSRPARPMILSGLRGVGKTVLLRRLKALADHHQWLTIKFEARPGAVGATEARHTFARELQAASRKYTPMAAGRAKVVQLLRTVSSFSTSVGVKGVTLGVEVDPTRATTGLIDVDIRDVVEDVAGALRGLKKGFAVFIDEMQDLDDEFTAALLSAQHHASQEGLPFFVIGAGLPNLPGKLAESRSYAERLFDYRTIGKLKDEDAKEAFTAPAGQVGQSYSLDALEAITAASGQYPYFIQEFGSAMWQVANKSPFNPSDADAAIILGRERLDAGFFPSRWQRATKAEREYLNAMARDDEGPSQTGDVAARLQKKIQSLGPIRAQLISKGLVYAPEHGQIAFTVPGMAGFIERQHMNN